MDNRGQQQPQTVTDQKVVDVGGAKFLQVTTAQVRQFSELQVKQMLAQVDAQAAQLAARREELAAQLELMTAG